MRKSRKPKDWLEIQNDFEAMQQMSCVPVGLHKLKPGTIIDEDRSVRWNREEVERNNAEYQVEVARLNTEKNKRRDAIYEDIYYAIQCEVGHGLSKKAAVVIFGLAYEEGHAFGIHEIMSHLETFMGLAALVLTDKEEA